jgi:hypothetical protein
VEKVVAICQPNFMPWLGYFEMGHRADVYVMLDDVQYIKQEWINRNRVLNRSDEGWQWINVPLYKKKQKTLINEIEIQNSECWSKKILKTLHHVYSKAPFYSQNIELFEDILSREWLKLLDLNIEIIKLFYSILGMKDNLLLSSELSTATRKDNKLADICEKLGATIYLANNGSKPYIDSSKFYKRGLGFIFQDYQHPVYSVGSFKFTPYLSVIDLVFWHGPASLEIILKGRKKNWKDDVNCV